MLGHPVANILRLEKVQFLNKFLRILVNPAYNVYLQCLK